jgi:DNA-binding transcriptional regulator GbsR (MarR family)
MARIAQKIPEETVKTATELRDSAKTIAEYRRAVLALIYFDDKHIYTSDQLAELFGISKQTLFDDLSKVKNYSNLSERKINSTPGGRKHSYMTIEEEANFLSEFEEESINGIILNAPQIHEKLNERVGKIVPKSTLYRMLERHNWRKVKPDTKHPKRDTIIQREFKNNSPFIWVKIVSKT